MNLCRTKEELSSSYSQFYRHLKFYLTSIYDHNMQYNHTLNNSLDHQKSGYFEYQDVLNIYRPVPVRKGLSQTEYEIL